jgi:hypothetical protein
MSIVSLTQYRGAVSVEADDVERVLADIDANDGDRAANLGHGVLLVWLPPASILLARQEHGRTIPLPDISPKMNTRQSISEAP